jgi:hypothetical protein
MPGVRCGHCDPCRSLSRRDQLAARRLEWGVLDRKVLIEGRDPGVTVNRHTGESVSLATRPCPDTVSQAKFSFQLIRVPTSHRSPCWGIPGAVGDGFARRCGRCGGVQHRRKRFSTGRRSLDYVADRSNASVDIFSCGLLKSRNWPGTAHSAT